MAYESPFKGGLKADISGSAGRNTKYVTASTTLTSYERDVSCAQTGTITLTLPDAGECPGAIFGIYSTVNAATNTITITSADGTVNGGSDEVINASSDGYAILISTGSRWLTAAVD